MAIVSLSGRKQSGKSTIGNLFEKHLPKGKVRQVAFAAKLKKVVAAAFCLAARYTFSEDEKEKRRDIPKVFHPSVQEDILRMYDLPIYHVSDKHIREFYTPREMLQYIGADFLRSIQEDIHLKNLLIGKPGEVTIVTDTRFENEHDYLREYAAKTGQHFVSFFIHRPGIDNNDGHVSEQMSSEVCFAQIVNDSTLFVLDEHIKQISKNIMNDFSKEGV